MEPTPKATLYAKKDGVVKKVSSLHVKEGEVKELHARSWVWKKTGNGPGGLTYMQDFASLSYDDWHKIVDAMPEHQPYTLTDKRDGNTYIIAKLKDNRVWMCQNLRLGGDKDIVLTPEDTDISENFTLPISSTNGFFSGSDDRAWVYVDSTCGGFYSWYAATAGTGTTSIISGNVTSSIFPKGWGLPTKDELATMTEKYGSRDDGSSWLSALLATPVPGFVLSGYYYSSSIRNPALNIDQGSLGYYWSSTATQTGPNTRYAFYLDLTPSNVYIFNTNRYPGHSIRGILREPSKQAQGGDSDSVT